MPQILVGYVRSSCLVSVLSIVWFRKQRYQREKHEAAHCVTEKYNDIFCALRTDVRMVCSVLASSRSSRCSFHLYSLNAVVSMSCAHDNEWELVGFSTSAMDLRAVKIAGNACEGASKD